MDEDLPTFRCSSCGRRGANGAGPRDPYDVELLKRLGVEEFPAEFAIGADGVGANIGLSRSECEVLAEWAEKSKCFVGKVLADALCPDVMLHLGGLLIELGLIPRETPTAALGGSAGVGLGGNQPDEEFSRGSHLGGLGRIDAAATAWIVRRARASETPWSTGSHRRRGHDVDRQ